MLNYFLLLPVFAIFFQIYGYNEPRIKNGVLTPPNLFQFVVKANGGCTGTVISKRHVLIAAHCINKKGFTMHERYQEAERFVHTNFREDVERVNYTMKNGSKVYDPITWYSWGADIAIIEYEEGTNLGLPTVKLAKDYIEKDGDEAYIAGFGLIERPRNIKDLYYANITMKIVCYGTLLICGGNETYHSLGGDSGGPMLIYRNDQWYQIGVSHGHSFNTDIRTRISSYCNFIEEVTKNEVKCESIYPENYYNGQILPIKHFEPIYQGQTTPLKLFNFVVPLYNYYYNQGCTATVISKRYLLTSAWCVYRDWIENVNKNAQLTEHSSYKTMTGKLFPDFRSKNVQTNLNPKDDVTAYFPLNYKWPWDHNIAVIEFPDGINFGVEPVTLAKDHFPIYLEEGIIAGYGKYEISNDMHMKEPPILRQSNGALQKIEIKVPNENFNLTKDEGGPVLIDRNGKFYQIGVNFASGTTNGSRTYVSPHCNFIEEVTKNEVKCESTLPIYEMPFTTFLPQYENPSTTESANSASAMIELNLLSIIFIAMYSIFVI